MQDKDGILLCRDVLALVFLTCWRGSQEEVHPADGRSDEPALWPHF
jgi:hypothetical protein